jgi:hypothetical protein
MSLPTIRWYLTFIWPARLFHKVESENESDAEPRGHYKGCAIDQAFTKLASQSQLARQPWAECKLAVTCILLHNPACAYSLDVRDRPSFATEQETPKPTEIYFCKRRVHAGTAVDLCLPCHRDELMCALPHKYQIATSAK